MKTGLKIFLGDVDEEVGISAKSHDPSAWLLHQGNLHLFDQRSHDEPTTIYTSLGDLPKNLTIVFDVLKQADVIFYTPPKIWSDNRTVNIMDPGDSMQGLTESLLLLLPDSVEIIGLDPLTPMDIEPISLADQRKTDGKQMWVAGCSVSNGDGVEKHERYGALLADHFDIPCSFLTRSSSSISWAADQILRSDIKSGDLVVWGLTTWSRFTHIHEHQMLNVTPSSFLVFPEWKNIVDIKMLWSQTTFYQHFYSIRQVINYCKKINARLLLVGLLHDNYALLGYLKSQPNYIQMDYNLRWEKNQLSYSYIDLGTDHSHPGPLQHLVYKNTIVNFLKKHHISNSKT